MCGIAGIIGEGKIPRNKAGIHRMLDSIRYRGPDSANAWSSHSAAMGAVRLQIIGGESGAQPITNQDNSLVLVCNGEIFNYRSLKKLLLGRGYKFKTDTDIEVLLHLYDEYGDSFLEQVYGQFAFAIYETASGKLILGRDRAGVCPLFYCRIGSQIVFASEVKALFSLSEVPRKFATHSIQCVLSTWTVPAPLTVFQEIFQLEPGVIFEYQNGREQKRPFWQIKFSQAQGTAVEMKETLRELMEQSVKRHLVSDVPVGLYLSGGVDSSILAALVSRNSEKQLKSFSVSFSDDRFDESSFQKEVATKWNVDHHILSVTGADIADNFSATVEHAETILFRTAPVPLFLLSKEVNRAGIRVVVSGEGADEVFWGYDSVRELLIRLMWARNPSSTWRPEQFKNIFSYVDAYNNPRGASLLKKFYEADLSNTTDLYYALRPRWRANQSLLPFLSRDLSHKQLAADCFHLDPTMTRSALSEMDHFQRYQLFEMKGLLAGYLLSSQGDRMLMAHSVEGRPPFLDKDVISFAASIPNRLKCRGLKDKFLLREAFKDELPLSVYKRPKFAYRSPDAGSFFPTEKTVDYVEHYMSKSVSKAAGLFDPEKVQALYLKLKKNGAERASNRDNMAVTSILSSHILKDSFGITL